MEAQTRETRKPVSFRIPRNEMALIEEYATTHRVSKSDALIHYLRKGLDADSDLRKQLDSIQQALESVLGHVQIPASLPSLSDISEAFCKIACDYPAITNGYLFGSFARGDATSDSDIDLRLEYDDASGFSLFDLARLKKDLEKALGRETDIITARAIENEKLRKAIDREKVLIYERV